MFVAMFVGIIINFKDIMIATIVVRKIVFPVR